MIKLIKILFFLFLFSLLSYWKKQIRYFHFFHSFLSILQNFLDTNPTCVKTFPYLLHFLYDEDIIDDEAVSEWKDDMNEEGDEKWIAAGTQFFDWLETAEDEDDEDEDDEENDE